MNVLVIEDDIDVAETICSVLEGFFENVHIKHINDGENFRKGEWRSGGWDLVILDLMMPGMTGFEACETIRANKATHSVPVFALTGYDTLQNEKRIKASGATGYMAKPFDVTLFMEEIKRITKDIG